MSIRLTPDERKANRKAGTLRRAIHFRITGAQTTGTTKFSCVVPEAGEYVGFVGRLDTAPTGATTFKVDVNKNGTTLYTTQTNQPTWVAADNDSAEAGPADGATSLARGDRLTVDIDAIGSTVAGSDFDFAILYDA